MVELEGSTSWEKIEGKEKSSWLVEENPQPVEDQQSVWKLSPTGPTHALNW